MTLAGCIARPTMNEISKAAAANPRSHPQGPVVARPPITFIDSAPCRPTVSPGEPRSRIDNGSIHRAAFADLLEILTSTFLSTTPGQRRPSAHGRRHSTTARGQNVHMPQSPRSPRNPTRTPTYRSSPPPKSARKGRGGRRSGQRILADVWRSSPPSTASAYARIGGERAPRRGS